MLSVISLFAHNCPVADNFLGNSSNPIVIVQEAAPLKVKNKDHITRGFYIDTRASLLLAQVHQSQFPG